MKDENYTILAPQMLPIHFDIIEPVFHKYGYNLEILKNDNRKAIDVGLKYVNNDACFPSITIVGQFMEAVTSGRYDTDKARHGQDYPIGVLGLIGAVVGYECMNDFVWNVFGCKCGNRFNFLMCEGYFILPKRTKLQSIGKNIVKAEHPRALGGARKDRRLKLLNLIAPFLVKVV